MDLPQPLRPTRPVRSRPNASVSPSNSVRPSGVAREMEYRITNTGMENFRDGQVSRRGLLGDIHLRLHEFVAILKNLAASAQAGDVRFWSTPQGLSVEGRGKF